MRREPGRGKVGRDPRLSTRIPGPAKDPRAGAPRRGGPGGAPSLRRPPLALATHSAPTPRPGDDPCLTGHVDGRVDLGPARSTTQRKAERIATAALVSAGATSRGELIALVVEELPAKTGAKLGKE
jgi:hypothetical protein